MRLLLQISSLLVVLCASGVFSSPSVDRDRKTYLDCRNKCGSFFTGELSDDAQVACLNGCCSAVRSLSHHVHSEILQDEEEERNLDDDTLKEKFPKTFVWWACIRANSKPSKMNWFTGVTECCKAPPV